MLVPGDDEEAHGQKHPILTIFGEPARASDLRILLEPFAGGILVNRCREALACALPGTAVRVPVVDVQSPQEPRGDGA